MKVSAALYNIKNKGGTSMRRIVTLFSTALILFSLIGCSSEIQNQSEKKGEAIQNLEVHFIDVGQGDATLIKCGDASMLIDGGENDKGTFLQNYMNKQGVKSLDYFIVTHPDSDHCGGADVIITKYDIDTVIMPNYEKDTVTYRDVVQSLDYKKYSITSPVVGNTYSLGDAEFTIIGPNKKNYGDETNNYSVAIVLKHGKNKFVFTGDAEEEAEMDIINNKIDISAQVLKVGHHGSKSSSTEKFIKAVGPEYGVISCGENNEYGHPHGATLNTLRKEGVKVFRTDEQGSVVATSDGNEIIWNMAPTDSWKAGEPIKASTDRKKKDRETILGSQKDSLGNEIKEETEETTNNTKKVTYILNTQTKKFHKPVCDSLPTANRLDSVEKREELIAQEYVPCKQCNP